MRSRWWILLICSSASFAAQSELPRELAMLAQIKARMASNLARAPNYTCLETIERSRRDHPSQHFQFSDRVRVEVALVNRKEMFSWPGSESFQADSLYDLVGGGTTSTGDFVIHARVVFATHLPTYAYKGEEHRDGRLALHYSYRVSRLVSGYTVKIGGKSTVAGFHGDFWADRDTLDVMRLEVDADDFAEDVGLSGGVTEIEYRRARIGESEFLLPQSVVITLKFDAGDERRNQTVFTGCRQYVGRSSITFGDSPETASSTTAEVAELELPAGLLFGVRLTSPVDSETSAVGDPIAATVLGDVKANGRKLVPRGATLTGRIRRLERRMGRADVYLLGLEFSRLEFGNRRAKFFGELVTIGPIFGMRPRQSMVLALVEPNGTGLLALQTSRFRLAPGFRMEWRTAAPTEPPARPRSTAR